MTLEKILEHANGEPWTVEGVTLDVIVSKCLDSDFLQFKMHPITELHAPSYLGGKWIEYITAEELADFENEIKRHREKAEEFYRQAQRVAKATLLKNGRIQILDYPENIQSDWNFYENEERRAKAIKQFVKHSHPIRFIGDKKTEFYALGNFSIDLDGVLYVPHWSYWLDRPYYITTTQILESAGE
jgi:hypothetical protein